MIKIKANLYHQVGEHAFGKAHFYILYDVKTYMKLLLLSNIINPDTLEIYRMYIIPINQKKLNKIHNNSIKYLLNFNITNTNVKPNIDYKRLYDDNNERYLKYCLNNDHHSIYTRDILKKEIYSIVMKNEAYIDHITKYCEYVPSFISLKMIEDTFSDIEICF